MMRLFAGIIALSICAGGNAFADPPPGLRETAVDIPVPGGLLRGTVWVPVGQGPFPGVVIVAGSGPTDRDGNNRLLTNNSLKMLASALGRRGIATLRFDKRMIAGSRLSGVGVRDLRFDHFVADAVAWVKRLRAVPGVGRVFLAGHSQGALVATLAAAKTKVAGLILIAGPAEPIGRIMARQLKAAPNVPHWLLDRALKAIALLERGEQVPKVDRALWSLFHPALQPFLISWMRHDPAAALKAVNVPVLIVQGDRDLQVGVDQARKLAAARAGAGSGPKSIARLVVVPGMNHVFKVPKGVGRKANVAAYNDPSLPLAPGFAKPIADFIQTTK